jgi:hypothetical protein
MTLIDAGIALSGRINFHLGLQPSFSFVPFTYMQIIVIIEFPSIFEPNNFWSRLTLCNANENNFMAKYVFIVKLRVGNKPIGRYTPYSQVRTPPSGKYPSDEADRYYRHPRGARITKASHFDYEYVLGHKIVFICVAKGKPRPKIIWFKDGRELYDHNYLHISEWYKGKGRLKSKMEIDPATQGDAGIYECHANNKWSVDMRSFRTDYNIFFD